MTDQLETKEEPAGVDERVATEPPVISHSHHDHINDRTGELVEAVASVVDGRHRSVLAMAQEPGTGVAAPFILAPDGSVEPIPARAFDDYRDAPARVTDTSTTTRIESFIDLVNRFKNPNTAIFARESIETPRLTAIVDYHAPSNSAGDIAPAFCRHQIAYPFPLSREWKTWIAQNGKPMSLIEFATFIEDNIVNVQSVDLLDLNKDMQQFIKEARGKLASPTNLFELSRGLSVNENSKVVEVRNLSTGEGQVTFASEHVDEQGAPLSIPNMFVICIPVWDKSSDYYRIVARLRYRARGELKFWFDLWRADLVFQNAFDEVLGQVEERTGQPVFVGSAA